MAFGLALQRGPEHSLRTHPVPTQLQSWSGVHVQGVLSFDLEATLGPSSGGGLDRWYGVKAALWRGPMLIREYFTSEIISDRG